MAKTSENNEKPLPLFKSWKLQIGSHQLDADHTAVIVPIVSDKQLEPRLFSASVRFADLVEIRADLVWPSIEEAGIPEQMGHLRSLTSLPLIFTFRSKEEGGQWTAPLSDRLREWDYLVQNKLCDAVDIEFSEYLAQPAAYSNLLELCSVSGVKTIFSHHNYDRSYTAAEVRDILTDMKRAECDLPKLACIADDQEAALEIVRGGYSAALQLRQCVIAIAMGRYGRITRLAGHDYGQAATFASGLPDSSSAPGQLPADSLKNFLGD